MLNAIGLRRRRRSEVVYEDAVQLADGRMTVDDHEEIRQLIALHAQFLDERRGPTLRDCSAATVCCRGRVKRFAGDRRSSTGYLQLNPPLHTGSNISSSRR
jgi:hypothetical protein